MCISRKVRWREVREAVTSLVWGGVQDLGKGPLATLCPSLSVEKEKKHRNDQPFLVLWKIGETLEFHFPPLSVVPTAGWTSVSESHPHLKLSGPLVLLALPCLPFHRGSRLHPSLRNTMLSFLLSFQNLSLPPSQVFRWIRRLPSAELRNLFFCFLPSPP